MIACAVFFVIADVLFFEMGDGMVLLKWPAYFNPLKALCNQHNLSTRLERWPTAAYSFATGIIKFGNGSY
jgi:hypothetical protein